MWQPAGTGARSEFTALFENERVRGARRVALLRLLMTWAFLALSVLAVVAGYASTAARIVPLGIYALLALALYAAVRRSASLARHSWYALAFVDLPMIFTMQYQATLANFERTPVIATFTFSVFLFVLIASQLSLRRRNILATAAVAAFFEVALLARAEIVYVILDVLVVAFGSAVAASYLARRNVDLLQSALTQRRLTDRLARYFAPAVVQRILQAGEDTVSSQAREVTVLFSDIRDFTAMASVLSSAQVVEFLDAFHSAMAEVLFRHDGTLDKFMGDGMLAYFGAPLHQPDHAERAVVCALDMERALHEFNRGRAQSGLAPVAIGIGIHTGVATVGDIGPARRREYTVVGDPVNLASRIEGLTKRHRLPILVSAATRARTGERFAWKPVGIDRVRGEAKPVETFAPSLP